MISLRYVPNNQSYFFFYYLGQIYVIMIHDDCHHFNSLFTVQFKKKSHMLNKISADKRTLMIESHYESHTYSMQLVE